MQRPAPAAGRSFLSPGCGNSQDRKRLVERFGAGARVAGVALAGRPAPRTDATDLPEIGVRIGRCGSPGVAEAGSGKRSRRPVSIAAFRPLPGNIRDHGRPMCGIAGKFRFSGDPVDPAEISRMCGRIVHRGPDAEGVHVGPWIGLGQRRLSIIDLSDRANPPLSNEDGTIWIVLNGEIYNYRELREELIGRGHVFGTASDTEVIVHAYEEFGPDCVSRFNGMFAFALWDGRQRRLFAARDRFGEKPFFYAPTGRTLVFGSQPKTILEDPDLTAEPDFAAIDAYLTLQYVPSPASAFAGIRKLPPGHILLCGTDGRLRIEPYWAPPAPAPSSAGREMLRRRLRDRLEEAVASRMVADVPVGAFLSGGIDSATVVALMARYSSAPVKTFSIGFGEPGFNELPFAAMVARRYGTDHRELVVEPGDGALVTELVRHYNEPFADSSALPTYYVSALARSEVTVALSGDGGDESFGGYERYGRVLAWQAVDRVPAAIRRAGAGAVRALAEALPDPNLGARMERAATMVEADLPERYRLQFSTFKPQEKRALYTPEFRSKLAEPGAAGDLFLAANDDPLAWMTRHDQRHYLPDCLMVKADIASMAHSLELRAPLLDHRLVEFAATIPSGLKRNGHEGKLILKEAVADLLPPALLDRPKTGFGIPLAHWLRTSWSDLLRATLCDDRAARRGIFDPQRLALMVDQHLAGSRDWSNRLWAALMLELWFREFID